MAIPTSGISMLMVAGWHIYKWRQNKAAINAIRNLPILEKSVLLAVIQSNGSAIGVAIDELKYTYLKFQLITHNIPYREYEHINCPSGIFKPFEFSLMIFDVKYDVDVQPGEDQDAVLRVRIANQQIDALYEWIATLGMPHTLNKWDMIGETELYCGHVLAESWPKHDSAIPNQIVLMKNLKTLALVNRRITEIPKTISRLEKLEELKLGGNSLTELPDEVCNLKHLRMLTFWYSKVTRLPEKIGNLRLLEGLDFSYNGLLSLPESVIELRGIKRLYMNGNSGIILSDRQTKWLVHLIEAGTKISMDTVVAKQLPLNKISQEINLNLDCVYFNSPPEDTDSEEALLN